MDAVERSREIQRERIDEFSSFGIRAKKGTCSGEINLTATEAEKVLRMLRRQARLESKKKN